jgi:hypothetical protein
MYRIIGGDQKVYGPVTGDDLRRWIVEGRLNARSLVQAEGAVEWKPLSDFPEFAEALRGQTGQPPLAGAPALAISAEVWTDQILARQPQVQIRRCLSLSWQLVMSNFGLFFGATFLAWLIGLACQFIPFIGALVYWAATGVLFGGLYLVFLNRIRGQPASIGDLFAGFKSGFAQLLLVGFLTALLTKLGLVCCLVLPGLYLYIAWTFSVPLVADQRLEFWSAMELSRKVVTRVWFEIFGLTLLVFLPLIVVSVFAQIKMSMAVSSMILDLISSGSSDPTRLWQIIMQVIGAAFPLWLLTRVVLLLNLPFAVGALMYAYEDLFGARTTPTA